MTAAVIAVAVGSVAMSDRLLAFLGAILLLSAVAEWLLPTRFELNAEGIVVRNAFRSASRPWGRLREWSAVEGGFWLPGRTRSKVLRRLRGVLLRCPGREAEIEAALRLHLGEPRA